MKTNTRIEEAGLTFGARAATVAMEGIIRVGIGAFISMAGLIGVWALAAMISGIAKAGGFLELGRAWLNAVTGM